MKQKPFNEKTWSLIYFLSKVDESTKDLDSDTTMEALGKRDPSTFVSFEYYVTLSKEERNIIKILKHHKKY